MINIEELICGDESTWEQIQSWLQNSPVHYEVLSTTKAKAEHALYNLQVHDQIDFGCGHLSNGRHSDRSRLAEAVWVGKQKDLREFILLERAGLGRWTDSRPPIFPCRLQHHRRILCDERRSVRGNCRQCLLSGS